VLGGGALACATMLVTACTGSSSSPAASGNSAASATADPAPSSPTAAGSSAAAPSGASSGSASSTPAAVSVAGAWSGYGPCPDLEVQLGLAQGTTNTTYQVIDFTNRGQAGCVLQGSPGVNLAGGTPVAPIGLPAAYSGFAKAREITLQPGGVANALLQITDAHDYSSVRCDPVQAQYLIIYRPDDAVPVKLAYNTTACSRAVQMLQVSAVSVGTGG
jgi:Protein of unknown function (DUF4232)